MTSPTDSESTATWSRSEALRATSGSAMTCAPADGPDPGALRMMPSVDRTRIASRTDVRLTPSRSASARSPSSRSPSLSRFERIIDSISSITVSYACAVTRAPWLPCGWTTGIVWSNHSLVERSPERTTMASPLVKQHRRFPRPRDFLPLLKFKKPVLNPTRRRLERALTVWDLRAIAKRRTPKAAFDYTDGAADAELSLARARQA